MYRVAGVKVRRYWISAVKVVQWFTMRFFRAVFNVVIRKKFGCIIT